MFRLAALALAAVVAACGGQSAAPTYPIAGVAVAGPTCPVEPASPEPGQCLPRPVPGAVLVILDPNGREVARVTTDANGAFTTTLPAGSYALAPQPVEGLMGGASPVEFTVSASEHPSDLSVEYDTGIR